MDSLFQALANPGSMTGQQWVLLSFMVVVIVGVLFLVRRLYRMTLSTTRKEPYVPKIGSKRVDVERDRRKR